MSLFFYSDVFLWKLSRESSWWIYWTSHCYETKRNEIEGFSELFPKKLRFTRMYLQTMCVEIYNWSTCYIVNCASNTMPARPSTPMSLWTAKRITEGISYGKTAHSIRISYGVRYTYSETSVFVTRPFIPRRPLANTSSST